MNSRLASIVKKETPQIFTSPLHTESSRYLGCVVLSGKAVWQRKAPLLEQRPFCVSKTVVCCVRDAEMSGRYLCTGSEERLDCNQTFAKDSIMVLLAVFR